MLDERIGCHAVHGWRRNRGCVAAEFLVSIDPDAAGKTIALSEFRGPIEGGMDWSDYDGMVVRVEYESAGIGYPPRTQFVMRLVDPPKVLRPCDPSLRVVAQTAGLEPNGHGFLIDKHRAAGLACTACHREMSPPNTPGMATCVACHGSYAQIAAKTTSAIPNPHASHLGEIACSTCHHMHKASQSFCDRCHSFGMSVP